MERLGLCSSDIMVVLCYRLFRALSPELFKVGERRKIISDSQTHQPICYLLNRDAQLTSSERRMLLEWGLNSVE